jgi:hypothetical protein
VKSFSIASNSIGRSIPDRPVLTTATRSFVHNLLFTSASSVSQIRRLQRPVWSDPNVHRAALMAHKECGWKHGERAVFRHRFLAAVPQTTSALSGPGPPTVNGIDRGGPSHGRIFGISIRKTRKPCRDADLPIITACSPAKVISVPYP